MLSRTADHLFWMCRYTERAENTARMLSVNLHMSLLPRGRRADEQSWRAMLRISELQAAYAERHVAVDARNVMHYLVREPHNPSSIYACLRASRENARAVRGSLSTEVWETVNTTWLSLLKLFEDGLPESDPARFFEWVKFRAHLIRGVIDATMLADEALCFMRLGSYLEQADNTARLLDVKFHEVGTLNQEGEGAGGRDEFYRWSAILASISGLEVYRKVYRDVVTPARVAELLILRGDMPRSLRFAMRAVVANLDLVANQRSAETQRLAGMLLAELEYGRLDDLLRAGLHHYLENFLARVNDLADRIRRDFLVALAN